MFREKVSPVYKTGAQESFYWSVGRKDGGWMVSHETIIGFLASAPLTRKDALSGMTFSQKLFFDHAILKTREQIM
jgi:hypothetical protein